jgi:hypothetical protein
MNQSTGRSSIVEHAVLWADRFLSSRVPYSLGLLQIKYYVPRIIASKSSTSTTAAIRCMLCVVSEPLVRGAEGKV